MTNALRIALLAGTTVAPLGAADAPPAHVRAVTLPAPSLAEHQFVQADKDGRVFLLDSRTLDVLPLTARGLGAVTLRLTPRAPLKEPVSRAAMGTTSDVWFVKANDPCFFAGGEEKPLPPAQWWPDNVALLGDTPVIAVRPGLMIGARPANIRDMRLPEEAPWLLSLSGDRWEPLVTGNWKDTGEGMGDTMTAFAVKVAASSNRSFWMAREYAYRVRRLSPTGRLREELVVGEGTPTRLSGEAIAAAEKNAAAFAAAHPKPGQAPGSSSASFFTPMTNAPVIKAITEGRDGRLYVLATVAGDLVLDRYDPVVKKMGRVRLPFTYTGIMSMAAGKDGLFFAAYQAKAGRWLVPWEELERARWSAVTELQVN